MLWPSCIGGVASARHLRPKAYLLLVNTHYLRVVNYYIISIVNFTIHIFVNFTIKYSKIHKTIRITIICIVIFTTHTMVIIPIGVFTIVHSNLNYEHSIFYYNHSQI